MPKINNEYDIGAAFQAIENELISSMIRNMKRHKLEEADEDMQWSMWQAEQLKALEKYQKANQAKYGRQFQDINSQIWGLIRAARDEGDMQQEIAILEAIKKGFPASKTAVGASAEFFRLNERKLEALIKATTDDMEKAETAVLRMANDQYRKAIYNAQVYANSGAGTYEKAVDMATKDFLAAGLNCVQYKNGARHTLSDYADMTIRTACKRAYLQGEGQKRQEWGIATVIMNKRGNPCSKCLPFVGKILIDDVWSGGSRRDGKYPLMSAAVAAGLYHPRCKDSHTTYFEGISTPPDDKYSKKELEAIEKQSNKETKQQYAKRQQEKFERLSKYSLDQENRGKYEAKANEWAAYIVGEGTESGRVAKYIGNGVDNAPNSGILKPSYTKEVIEVHSVGKIDRDIYKCITNDIVTDEVVITDNQIQHIKDRHPESFQRTMDNLKITLEEPDFIIEDKKHRNTGLVIKRLNAEDGHTQMVLRICTSEDAPGYKNSIISSWEISEKRLQNYLRNNQILYKKE